MDQISTNTNKFPKALLLFLVDPDKLQPKPTFIGPTDGCQLHLHGFWPMGKMEKEMDIGSVIYLFIRMDPTS